jgi:hypothetical protein
MHFPLCVGCMCDGTMFSFVCALPSTASAEGCPFLFGRFTGTTAQSDFSSACVPAVRFMVFADRPWSSDQGVLGDLPVLVQVVSQRARVLRLRRTDIHLRIAWLPCCLPPLGRSRHPDPSAFRSSIAPPTGTSGLRFMKHLAMFPARLEARMGSLFSFPVGLLHPLQNAGLARRSPICRQSIRQARWWLSSWHLDGIDEYGGVGTVGNPGECIVDRVGCVFR